MRVRFARTTAEEYQLQSQQARSRLPHEVNNQYGGGILGRRCCVRGSMCIKTHWIAMRAVGEVMIYEQELTTLQYHSKCTNISYRNYFTGSFIHCRNYFAVLIIRCKTIFAKFIFVALDDYENILTTKISRFTVCLQYTNTHTHHTPDL